MRHANQGLELWYGTPDAPAPAGTTEGRDQIQIVLGVQPAQPATSASVRYRVNGGSPLVEPAIRITTDYARNVQYFRAALRALRPGDFVEARADKDVLIVMSNCPQFYNPCSGWNPTPIRLIVWRPT